MWNFDTNEVTYGIPAHSVYMGERLWNSEKNKSKYFDLQKDVQVGLHLESIDTMRQEYLDQVCGGIPWEKASIM